MAYTVLDSKNIDKKKNIYTFGGSGTKPEREDIAENSKLIDYSSGQKFYYDPSKAAGSKWQPDKADKEPSGGSLPDNFPEEDAANANKFVGFDENGDYTAKEGGGGSLPANFPEEDISNANKLIGFDASGNYDSVLSSQITQFDPLIVRMSLDDPDSPTKLVSDCTFGVIHTAAVFGRVVIVVTLGAAATNILDCSRDDLTGDITIYFLSSGTVANATGGAEDYIEFPI